MGAPVLNLRGRRRWSELTRVERVGLYTRQSLYVLLWLFNVSVVLPAALDLDDTAEAAALLGGGLAVSAFAFAAFLPSVRRWPDVPPPSWRRLGPLAVVSAAVIVFAETSLPDTGQGAAVFTVVAGLVMVLSLQPGRRIIVALLLASALLYGLTDGTLVAAAVGLLIAGFFVFTVRASLWMLGIVMDLDEASQVKAELAVVEERLRFSRDVHDVLGRRLSTIAVQAELAATLASRGDERAAERMLEVRAVAHEALREARELARGYRATNFDNELEGARSLLRSAGIDVRLGDGVLPRAWHEAAGWVVREAVTNVLRHSHATCVRITYTDGVLRVENDGAQPSDGQDGSGLRSLRERLAPLGATLEAGPEDDDHWVVIAHLPGTGPLSATRREIP
ncbi:histidine kinase [Solirubrobacter phytolaccae]|uniref:Histidine kinase n=1 Tax=Solirubrobacter phytolaccae TaxID=1404360 RepID=A0A9X3SJR3_9ACTN|nr:histidine kinase [Solirubrobacter phytolaccae]MDA0185537.1 histidine kinase [Solirubrobacter phytolaccae]